MGDIRVNEVPGLSALHVLFQRQHNRLAKELVALLPSVLSSSPAAVDEWVFQTARSILAAQMQHITYTLWLPLVLGRSTIQRQRLDDVLVTYDDNMDPAIANVFATAAFRFGHSLVPDFLKYGDEHVPLHQTFANPKFVRKDLEKVLEGLLATRAQSLDAFFVSTLRNRLFESIPRQGLDLVALNIQRGRDHGLPPYNVWRQFCGLPPLTGFDPVALGEASASLREVYMSVDDIDLFTGGIAEPPLEGALVGPTFACIIGRQFFDLKFGDRFFYQTPGVFTPDQLHFIQGSTLAAMMCANTAIKAVQRNPFVKESDENPRLPCSQLPTSLSLDAWRQDVNRMVQRLTRN
ncbi:hypothetical protein C0Q70_10098 [Pomacea canaliculata]|uniref:Peroxidase n=1 Tax=Pomacea canaliculata TaxID=400727 RepID=A0A2T7PBM2_POMCA|nr:hypothetical protein C0Q70_10098 [Pomacea canaliculata]